MRLYIYLCDRCERAHLSARFLTYEICPTCLNAGAHRIGYLDPKEEKTK